MSDAGRKPLGDKISESLTPDTTKSLGQQAKEAITDKFDTAAGTAQPNQEKSFLQQAADNLTGSDKKDNTENRP